jgi:hypothetical protein
MPIEYEIDQSLGRELTGVVFDTTERVNRRRAAFGLPTLDGVDLANRTLHLVAENNRGSIMWNQPSLVRDRARLAALNPTVAEYAALCEDGRLDRPTRGAVSSIKTEHAHVTLKYVESKGLWIPKGEDIQLSLEDRIKTPLNFNKIHNHHCAAWGLTLKNYRSPLWDYVTPDQKMHILEISQTDPVLGNMIFAELTNTRAYDNYYQDVHGIRRRTAVTMMYDPHTTGIELVAPLVIFDSDGNVERLPKPKEMKKFNTTSFVAAVAKFKEQTHDPNIPDLGKFNDNYFDPDVFPEFFHELVDLTFAMSTGKVDRADGSVWEMPKPLMNIRRRFIDNFIDKNFSYLAPDSLEALKHHIIYGGWREYLLTGQDRTKEHDEVAASGSDTGSNLLKYVPWEQSIRYNIPVGSVTGVTRFLVARTVMDSTNKDDGSPHLNFMVSHTPSRVREIFDLIESDKEATDTISAGVMFPVAGVLDRDGMFRSAVPETVRSL